MLFLYIISAFLFAFLLFMLVGFLFFTGPNKRRDTSYFSGKMYAHRGLHDKEVPENSLQAFRLAKENGYGVELDVQMTRDGKLVVFHDGTLDRMCKIDGKLKDYTYEELSKFRLINKNGVTTEELIPLFSDVLETLEGVDIICEIKPDNGFKNYELCQKTYDMLMTHKGRFCVESFSPFLMGWFKNNHPEIIRGQLSENFVKSKGFSIANFCMSELWVNAVSRPDFVAYNHYHKTLGWKLVRKLYKPLYVAWTAKGKEEQEAAKAQYDAVIFEKEGPEMPI
ncbi:MAG: glycerophosphodiester phosphodiesterase [Lachnospiraceae bacterium]|nr:glycerophosphodiester phosphodiesterase [Lachnospiraceae bacterium]